MMSNNVGIVVGSFSPPNAGHLFVAEFARQFVDDLYIVLLANSGTVDPQLRRGWLQELFPFARLLEYVGDQNGLVLWIQQEIGRPVDYFFGSDQACSELAQRLSAEFIPIDPNRTLVPVNGELLRADPFKYWQYIPACVRPYFVKRVCVFGPESTGKSTLAINLARHFRTLSVPEWARTMISHRNDDLLESDLPLFARGQAAAEDALARQAYRLLFVDTDALISAIWSDWLYGRCDDSILKIANSRQYDLYLLTDVDVPWVADPQRYLPEKRMEFFERCKAELDKRSRPYVIVRGTWDERMATAVQAVEERCLGP